MLPPPGRPAWARRRSAGAARHRAAARCFPRAGGLHLPWTFSVSSSRFRCGNGLARRTLGGAVFALRPLIALGANVAPLQTLRRDDDSAEGRQRSAWRYSSFESLPRWSRRDRDRGLHRAGRQCDRGAGPERRHRLGDRRVLAAASVCARRAKRLAQLPWSFIVRQGITMSTARETRRAPWYSRSDSAYSCSCSARAAHFLRQLSSEAMIPPRTSSSSTCRPIRRRPSTA